MRTSVLIIIQQNPTSTSKHGIKLVFQTNVPNYLIPFHLPICSNGLIHTIRIHGIQNRQSSIFISRYFRKILHTHPRSRRSRSSTILRQHRSLYRRLYGNKLIRFRQKPNNHFLLHHFHFRKTRNHTFQTLTFQMYFLQ